MMRALREFGIAVQIIGAGSYQDRQRAAVSAAAAHQKVAYVSCHLNAFPDLNIPQRSSVFFDKRSSGGRTLRHTSRQHSTVCGLAGRACRLGRVLEPEGLDQERLVLWRW